MSRVTINEFAIRRAFERGPLAGTGLGGVGRRGADALAERMVGQAQKHALGEVLHGRTGDLAKSVRKIVRVDPRTGAIEVGVGSIAPYAYHLEFGAKAHVIRPNAPRKFLVSNGPRSKGPNPTPLRGRRRVVNHPGNPPKFWLKLAVQKVIGRGF